MLNLTLSFMSFGAFFCTSAGILIFLSGVAQRKLMRELLYALDFWTAAGLLKLTEGMNWHALITIAVIILVRKIATLTMKFHPQNFTTSETP